MDVLDWKNQFINNFQRYKIHCAPCINDRVAYYSVAFYLTVENVRSSTIFCLLFSFKQSANNQHGQFDLCFFIIHQVIKSVYEISSCSSSPTCASSSMLLYSNDDFLVVTLKLNVLSLHSQSTVLFLITAQKYTTHLCLSFFSFSLPLPHLCPLFVCQSNQFNYSLSNKFNLQCCYCCFKCIQKNKK